MYTKYYVYTILGSNLIKSKTLHLKNSSLSPIILIEIILNVIVNV